MPADRIALVVLSCDRYSDIWPVYFDLFFKNWPDCPFPVYLTSNHLIYPDARVTTLPAGADLDWSRCMRASLKGVAADRILFLIDDAFLTEPVSTREIRKLCAWCTERDVALGKISALPVEDIGRPEAITRLREDYPYRATLMGALWKMTVFLDILRDGETAQAFEIEGSKRTAAYPDFYYFPNPQFNFLHGIKKGRWYPEAVATLRRMGYRIDPGVRPFLPRPNPIRRAASLLRRIARRTGLA